ncbi:MAG: Tet(A)/Tet(B)/Tet(C) family tetracycline efflux MFS transporter [Alcaligenes sp.]
MPDSRAHHSLLNNRSCLIALLVLCLDAVGLGLIMPVLPSLLRELVPAEQVARHYGVLLSLYALMQIVFAPLLGRLSDKYGRRPVLLASLAGAALDYTVMALAPVLWVLYIGRLVSGITGATGAVVASTIADASPEQERARWFGYIGACYGLGMIAGPALGGTLAGLSTHAPFVGAALLNASAFVLACLFLRETRVLRETADKKHAPRFSSFGFLGLKHLGQGLLGLGAVFFIVQLIGQLPAALWVIFGEDRFGWDTMTVGLSLTAYGITHALFQAFAVGPLSQRLGERKTLLLGMMADATGFVLLAFALRSWMIFPVLALLAAGGLGMPALQSMMSKRVASDQQGTLQGVLGSLNNLGALIGPLGFTQLYSYTAAQWNGWVWLLGGCLYVLCFPVLWRALQAVD